MTVDIAKLQALLSSLNDGELFTIDERVLLDDHGDGVHVARCRDGAVANTVALSVNACRPTSAGGGGLLERHAMLERIAVAAKAVLDVFTDPDADHDLLVFRRSQLEAALRASEALPPECPTPREPVPAEVHERGWQWRPTSEDTAFAPPFGTIRACGGCGALVAGGPTTCGRCASEALPPGKGET